MGTNFLNFQNFIFKIFIKILKLKQGIHKFYFKKALRLVFELEQRARHQNKAYLM
jgi:hypothetical protein